MDEERNDWHLPKMTRRRSNATSCLSVALSLLIWTGGCLPPVLSHPQTGRIAYDVVQNLEFAEIRRYPAGMSRPCVLEPIGVGHVVRHVVDGAGAQ